MPDRFKLVVIIVYMLIRSSVILTSQDDRLKITVIDVGQGDSILVEYKGKSFLVDGGTDYSAAGFLSDKFLLNKCHINTALLTHPHADHQAGLNRVLSWCDVDNLIYYGLNYPAKDNEMMNEIVKRKRLSIRGLYEGDLVHIDDLTIYILWPTKEYSENEQENVNLYSYVLLGKRGDKEFILTGDAEEEILDMVSKQEGILADIIDGRVEIVKIAHHGSGYSLSEVFFELTRPLNCVISVGENNYGHPDPIVIKYLRNTGCNVSRTDRDGNIVFIL